MVLLKWCSILAEPKKPTGLAPHKVLQFDTTIPTNEFLEMPSDRIRFELGEVNKQLSAVEKELEAIANAGESGEKLALPAKFSWNQTMMTYIYATILHIHSD